ncbi:MAG: acetyl-CoA decarbonylase/synthase complex subunit gamma, partial [Bacillota bacterium]|nr:acetyl-CoA decarbonylase/synthase complex subunit gamma [Bacillota bacterium]
MEMGLTGLEIYKLLPKKNCRECNFPTCMAFAMALAGGKASLEACPYASEEARSALAEASEPPIRLVTIGTGEKALEVGGELVLFRHEKTFFHPTGVAIEVPDHLPDEELKGRAEAIRGLSFERVGLPLRVDLVALRHTAAEPQRLAAASRLVQEAAGLPLVLRTDDPAAAREALAVCGGERPLLWGAEQGNLEAMLELARQAQCPLVVSAGSLEELAELSQRAAAAGHRDLVLHPQAAGEGDLLAALTAIRRAALKKRFRPFGYP